MSLSKQVDEFTKSIQDIHQSRQTIRFDSAAQKLSDELNRKFKFWKGQHSMIWRSIQTFHSEYSKFKLTRTSGRSAPLVLVPVPHTQMLVMTPDVSHNP